ncbi:MAG: T9SS type A sorting domain-containing protein, partial [Prevotella sp.]|nr:T9SS type A sorting domain-containing protein [Prevotella sp.]
EAEGIESIRLMDMMGQVLEMNEYGRVNTATLHLGGYAPSVYLLEIKTMNGFLRKQIVLMR